MTKRRQRTLIEMVYFKSEYVQDLEDMIERFKIEQGEYAATEFINAIKSDKKLRAHLRRMGVDPDLA